MSSSVLRFVSFDPNFWIVWEINHGVTAPWSNDPFSFFTSKALASCTAHKRNLTVDMIRRGIFHQENRYSEIADAFFLIGRDITSTQGAHRKIEPILCHRGLMGSNHRCTSAHTTALYDDPFLWHAVNPKCNNSWVWKSGQWIACTDLLLGSFPMRMHSSIWGYFAST